MRFRTTALAALVLLTGVSSAHTATSTLNVRGTVHRLTSATPTACYTGEPCDPPIFAAGDLFWHRVGHSIVRCHVQPNGSFALHLAPGTYTVNQGPAMPRLVPATIRVPTTGVLHVTFRTIPVKGQA
jgi:hypothetical protein